MPPKIRNPKQKEETGFFAAYADLARVFRGWLVAYGVGSPVVFASQDSVMDALQKAPDARLVILAYLTGTVLQLVLVWLSKACMWWAYLEEMRTISKDSRRYRFADWFTNIFWIEGLVDFITVGLFIYATARILFIIAA